MAKKVLTVVWGAIVRDKTHPNADMHGLLRAIVRLPDNQSAAQVLVYFSRALADWRGSEHHGDEISARVSVQLISRSYSHSEGLATEGTQGIVYSCHMSRIYARPDCYTPYLEPRR